MSWEVLKLRSGGYEVVSTCVNKEQAKNLGKRLKNEDTKDFTLEEQPVYFIADIEMI